MTQALQRGFMLALSLLMVTPVMMIGDDAAVKRRLDDVCIILSGGPVLYESVFTAEFLKQVPPAKLTMLAGQLAGESGPCTGMRIVERRSGYQVSAEATTKNGYTIPLLLTIEMQAPYRIAGLFLRPPVKAVASLESLRKELETLPGRVSFHAANLGGGTVISSLSPSEQLPVGSTFKLYVLGELVRSIRQKERKWTDVVKLDSAWRSLPSGRLHTWPHGSPMTLHSLATMMISESDNTATDALIRLLGPNRISQQASAMGHDRPELNQPFLTTLQAFKLKYADASIGKRFAGSGWDERTEILRQIDSSITYDSITPTTEPVLSDKVEWFASTSDLCRAMDWFRADAVMQKDFSALDILGINPGVQTAKSWRHVGFKGGSEPGVINMTYLLEHPNGAWYCISGTWSNPNGTVEEMRFAGLLERAIQLLEK